MLGCNVRPSLSILCDFLDDVELQITQGSVFVITLLTIQNICTTRLNIKQVRQYKYKRNIEALSRKRCCRGKAVSIT
jgi:hypothetical protein